MPTTEVLHPGWGLRTLSRAATAAALNFSLNKLDALVRDDPTFPKPRLIGKRRYYLADEVREWLLARPQGGPGDGE